MITPSDTPSAPALYAAVAVQGMNIQADEPDLSGIASASVSAALARQAPTERLLASPQGYGAFTISEGSSGGAGEDWPGSIAPRG